jgi:hypothetical protein
MEALEGGEDCGENVCRSRNFDRTNHGVGSLEEVRFDIAWTDFMSVIGDVSPVDLYRSHDITTEETTIR